MLGLDYSAATIAGFLFVLILSLLAAGHAILNKRDSRSALGWVALILFAPMVGIVSYVLIGINRIRRRATLSQNEKTRLNETGDVDWTDIGRLSRDYIRGNQANCFLDSEQLYYSVRDSIRQAKESICLSVYIFESSGLGARIIQELGTASGRGVEVRVLLDGVGSLYSLGSTRNKLRKAGVLVSKFLSPSLIPPAWHINLRNHRKILIVDGKLAYIGGTNIRNAYGSGSQNPSVRDINFLLRGPIVGEIYDVFISDWLNTTNEQIVRGHNTYDSLVSNEQPDASCRVITDGPDNDVDLLLLAHQAAIGKAQRRIRLLTPYFLPPRELISALQLAAIRGVVVEVVLPKNSNLPFVNWATRNMLWELLRYDIGVYYQGGIFDHSKLLVIDEDYCLVGSANIDARSLRLNFEIGVEIQSSTLVSELNTYIEGRLTQSTQVTTQQLNERPLLIKLRDAAAWLFTPYL